jgi:hypothetical protein
MHPRLQAGALEQVTCRFGEEEGLPLEPDELVIGVAENVFGLSLAVVHSRSLRRVEYALTIAAVQMVQLPRFRSLRNRRK